MERLTARLLVAVLALVPAARREWGEAVLAEADQVPAGRARLSWLVGGLWRFGDAWFDQMRAFDRQSRQGDMRTQAALTAVAVILLMTAYGVAIVLVTARRAAAASTTLTLGVGLGAGSAVVTYVVMPLG